MGGVNVKKVMQIWNAIPNLHNFLCIRTHWRIIKTMLHTAHILLQQQSKWRKLVISMPPEL